MIMNEEQRILSELREIDEEARWQAVSARDARFNDVFFYGVRSTGIYCKPSCPSRRPSRQQLAFFNSREEAEAGGFRACRRCRPGDAAAHDPLVETVRRACRAIEGQTEGPLSLKTLGEGLGVNPHHLRRAFKRITGVTPRQYAAAHRLEQFKSLVREGQAVASAMYEAGYGSSSRLYEKEPARLGMTPAAYRRGGKGMSIDYAIVDCHLGRMLVAATGRGVCAVSFGESDEALEMALRAEYPAADVRRGGAGLEEIVAALLGHLEGAAPRLDLPLDLQATAFQLRVWEELRKIPYGATRSYAEVAEAIGQPSATRAVARACATNPVALINPCHRVVRSDGGLSGYRWGVGRKETLLRREKARAADRA
jgi:AraC family transcriptional regulator of adaptative response/methylated-DNA-[protein]-cysteine methyltransferase